MFNLSKHSAVETANEDLGGVLEDQLGDTTDQRNSFNAPSDSAETSMEDASQGLNAEESQAVIEKAAVDSYYRILSALEDLSGEEVSVRESLNSMPEFQELKAVVESQGDPAVLQQRLEVLGIAGRESSFGNVNEIAEIERSALARAQKTFENLKAVNEFKQIDQQRVQRQVAFNLKTHKTAQMMPGMEPMDPMQMMPEMANPMQEQVQVNVGSFPVVDAGDLVAKFMGRILSDDPRERTAVAEEILSQVQGDIQEEEINGMIESLMLLQYNSDEDQAKALNIFGKMFEILPSHLKGQADSTMEAPVMAKKNPKGIIKFNLSDHVLNNQQQPVTKTAADQFGQHYLLYGPSEKRICPKLRGWGAGGGSDVVSEYICRHHCLDGLVIDDNKTICGEAIWRANSMDKFSREYVDKDGEIVGGYLNKRFEINRNVPEENKMRLKPGETRKPRPASIYGNYEARMQEMRQKEGEKRGYRPDTNTGDVFKWCTDVDQNNVEQSQSTRDSREEAMGHQTVQYSEKPPTENNPKIASSGFNLQVHKTAQGGNIAPVVEDGKPIEPVEQKIRDPKEPKRKLAEKVDNDEIKKVEVSEFPKDTGCVTCTDSGEMPAKSGFNLQQHKTAKKKGVTYKGEHFDYNPWAVCNKSTGGKDDAGEEKFERCVQHVKDQDREDDGSESKKKT